MSAHSRSEDQLVEQPAIGLFAELGCLKTQSLRRTRDPATSALPRLFSGQVEPAIPSANGATSNQPGATPQVTERQPRKG